MEHVLEMENIRKRYGKRTALAGLDIKVPRGSVFGLVGSNGAGKTTCIGIAAGLIRQNSGVVRLFGGGAFDPYLHGGRMSLMPQDAALPVDACVGEVVAYYAELQGMDRQTAKQNAEEILGKVNLSDRITSSVRSLSHGMRRRVIIAQAFLGEPELIILDEPLSGLDPREVVNMRKILTTMKGRRTIVISSHNLHEIERICDYVAFIEDGRTVRQDRLTQITGRQCVVRFELDGGEAGIEHLSSGIAGVELSLSEDGKDLICRFNETERSVRDVNETVLKKLFESGVGVLSVRQGEGLEEAYIGLGHK